MAVTQGASRARLLSAFAVVYVVWGSTYLAIRFAIETMPPFAMAGMRFVLAGAVLLAWAMARGAGWPGWTQWRWAAGVGALLLLGGNGAVVWSEQRVPSSIAALLVASMALWMVLLDWARPGGRRPGVLVFVGLALGLAGIALLVGGSGASLRGGVDRLGALVLVLGSLSWATGSLVSRAAPRPAVPLLAAGMEMLAGGALLLLASLLSGEVGSLRLAAVSSRSVLSFLYLVTAGSLLGYSTYAWLLRHASAAKVATYVYVNPVVAVLLGWAFAGEAVTARTLAASAVIVAAVALVTISRSEAPPGPTCDAAEVGALDAA